MYDYLLTHELDERYALIALKVDFTQKVVVDLNCGKAGILDYIDSFKVYYANDINPDFVKKAPKKDNCVIKAQEDMVFAVILPPKIDILLCFGCTVGHFVDSPEESTTFGEAIRYILETRMPETLVLECMQSYQKEFKLLNILKPDNYEVTNHYLMENTDKPFWLQREMVICRRKDAENISNYL